MRTNVKEIIVFLYIDYLLKLKKKRKKYNI